MDAIKFDKESVYNRLINNINGSSLGSKLLVKNSVAQQVLLQFSSVMEEMGDYVDYLQQENNLETLQERSSLLSFSKLFNYKPLLKKSAITSIAISTDNTIWNYGSINFNVDNLNSSTINRVKIESIVDTSTNLKYIISPSYEEDYYITLNNENPIIYNIKIFQGEKKQKVFKLSEIVDNIIYTTSNKYMYIPFVVQNMECGLNDSSKYRYVNIKYFNNNGDLINTIKFNIVDNLLTCNYDDYCVELVLDNKNSSSYYLKFSNDDTICKKIPNFYESNNQSIEFEINYIQTDGEKANSNSVNHPLKVSLENGDVIYGTTLTEITEGKDEESIEDIKENLTDYPYRVCTIFNNQSLVNYIKNASYDVNINTNNGAITTSWTIDFVKTLSYTEYSTENINSIKLKRNNILINFTNYYYYYDIVDTDKITLSLTEEIESYINNLYPLGMNVKITLPYYLNKGFYLKLTDNKNQNLNNNVLTNYSVDTIKNDLITYFRIDNIKNREDVNTLNDNTIIKYLNTKYESNIKIDEIILKDIYKVSINNKSVEFDKYNKNSLLYFIRINFTLPSIFSSIKYYNNNQYVPLIFQFLWVNDNSNYDNTILIKDFESRKEEYTLGGINTFKFKNDKDNTFFTYYDNSNIFDKTDAKFILNTEGVPTTIKGGYLYHSDLIVDNPITVKSGVYPLSSLQIKNGVYNIYKTNTENYINTLEVNNIFNSYGIYYNGDENIGFIDLTYDDLYNILYRLSLSNSSLSTELKNIQLSILKCGTDNNQRITFLNILKKYLSIYIYFNGLINSSFVIDKYINVITDDIDNKYNPQSVNNNYLRNKLNDSSIIVE